MNYGLPKSVNIDGDEFSIRYDYRAILDIFEAMNDPELSDEERGETVLRIFYVDFESLTDYNKAIQECFFFINGGEDEQENKRSPQLISWSQDFRYMVSPINRVIGQDIRGIQYDEETNTGGLHWYTFLSAFHEIGDCLFSQIVNIRNKKARGKKLDKQELEFYRNNRALVDIKMQYSSAEDDLLKVWTGG